MAFKSVKQYNEERFGGLFMLRNDGDQADVIFLYRNQEDVLIGDTHYIKSPDYSGYVHCLGKGCPACGKNIRIQTKLFIPLYNVTAGEMQFWDRSTQFENQLMKEVFEAYPCPVDYVFRITRHGAARDVNTYYTIQAVAKNDVKSFDQILSEAGTSFPECFERVCKSVSGPTMRNMLTPVEGSGEGYSSATAGGSLPSYQVTPRAPRADIPESADKIPTVPAGSGVSIPGPDGDFGDDLDDADPDF